MSDPRTGIEDPAFETRAIRTRLPQSPLRENSTPIFVNSGHSFDTANQAAGLFAGTEEGFVYGRWENPNTYEYMQKLCALEGYASGAATATGMAAITATFLGLLSSGDHLLYCNAIFGATYYLINKILPRWNIDATAVKASASEAEWIAACSDRTKMIYVETPTNPTLEVLDLEMLSRVARKCGVLLCVDNCFATPYLQQPQKWGVDIVVHSATKFIDGQGRVLGGAILASDDLMAPIRAFIRATGPALSAFNAWVLSKSLETLALRMERHCEHAELLAEYLSDHTKVQSVCYPFHASHPAHETAKKQMKRGGGLVTFVLEGGYAAGKKLVEALDLFSFTANLGDSRTLVTHPASTTHSSLTAEERATAGVANGMIRVSVGLEHIDDIVAEFKRIL